MKKNLFYLFILFPFTSFAQCPKWIGSSVDSTLMLEKVAEQYLQTNLQKTVEKNNKSNIDYVDNTTSCEFFFSIYKQKAAGKGRFVAVSKIVIVGPEEKIKKMYDEYFYKLMKPCATSAESTSMKLNKLSIGYFSLPQKGKKLAEINLHK